MAASSAAEALGRAWDANTVSTSILVSAPEPQPRAQRGCACGPVLRARRYVTLTD